VIEKASLRNYVGIAPQAPVGNFKTGYYWEQELETIDIAHDSVIAAIDHATVSTSLPIESSLPVVALAERWRFELGFKDPIYLPV